MRLTISRMSSTARAAAFRAASTRVCSPQMSSPSQKDPPVGVDGVPPSPKHESVKFEISSSVA